MQPVFFHRCFGISTEVPPEDVCPSCGGLMVEETACASLRNFTPHPVTLHLRGVTVSLPSEGVVRVRETDRVEEGPAGLPVHHVLREDALDGLPIEAFQTVIIASALAARVARALGRTDVYAPGPAIRDAAGNVIAADGLAVPE